MADETKLTRNREKISRKKSTIGKKGWFNPLLVVLFGREAMFLNPSLNTHWALKDKAIFASRYYYSDRKKRLSKAFGNPVVKRGSGIEKADVKDKLDTIQLVLGLFNGSLQFLSYCELSLYRLIDSFRDDKTPSAIKYHGRETSWTPKIAGLTILKGIVLVTFGLIKLPFRIPPALGKLASFAWKRFVNWRASKKHKSKESSPDQEMNKQPDEKTPHRSPQTKAISQSLSSAQKAALALQAMSGNKSPSLAIGSSQSEREPATDNSVAQALSKHGMIEHVTAEEMARSAFGQACGQRVG